MMLSLANFLMLLVGMQPVSATSFNEPTSEEQKVAYMDNMERNYKPFPYSGDDIYEHVVLDYGKRAIRLEKDESISLPGKMKNRENCFIVMSKKDYYLYVYEAQGKDTVMLARYDCCFGLKKGNKERKGDMKTPNSSMEVPFKITQLADASTWKHDFGDGRGNIKSYGDYFLRLLTPGHSGIGIHGSTNNEVSVPGRASEGCIRLKDSDIIDLRRNYAFAGMKVVIKPETADDLPFEVKAMHKQNIERKRHLDPSKVLSNEDVQRARAEQGRERQTVASKADAKASAKANSKANAKANSKASTKANTNKPKSKKK